MDDRLEQMAARQAEAELEVKRCELALDEAKASLKEIQETLFPDLMEEMQLREAVTENGFIVKVRDEIWANISSKPENFARAVEAFRWLRDHGHDALIKNLVTAAANSSAEAEELVAKLKALGVDAKSKSSVHHMTLSSFVREKLRDGELPEEAETLLGVTRKRQTKIDRK